jgi:uncharacterized protein (TIGR03083 family)
MHAPGEDRFFTELRGCTAELARIIDGDLERPVPTCPGWTFRQLATHLGRGHRWAAQIVATRATTPIPMREVADGKLPQDPAQHAIWLNAGAGRVIEAVTAAGSDSVWTLAGIGPASFWTRRRAHEAAVHLADAQLAAGRDVDLAPEVAADGVDEWLARIVAGTGGTTDPARAQRRTCAETARDCIFTPPTLDCPAPANGWSHVHRPASSSSMATAKPTSRSAGLQPACCLS